MTAEIIPLKPEPTPEQQPEPVEAMQDKKPDTGWFYPKKYYD